MRGVTMACALALLLALTGCAHYPFNRPLGSAGTNRVYRFENLSRDGNSDELLIVLTFSGGGTRAAALSYGVLEELARTEILWEGRRKRLLDEVDVISSVSGGSFTAAYYCLFGDRLFSEFEPAFLERNITGKLALDMVAPRNWFRLPSTRFNNSDSAAERYGRTLFENCTYHRLAQRNRKPFLMVNATDLSLGAPFTFTQEQFDLLCSDLSAYPLARAVAASSAFPGLLSPITLKNYAGECFPPAWIWTNAPAALPGSKARRDLRQAELRSYLSATNRPFIHLIDGGISDNLGLRVALNMAQHHQSWLQEMLRRPSPAPRRIVFFVVNAEVAPNHGWDLKDQPPNPLQSLMPVVMTPIRQNSFDAIEQFKSAIQDLVTEPPSRAQAGSGSFPGSNAARDRAGAFEFTLVEVGFRNLADPAERERFQSMPTRFNLRKGEVDDLRAVAGRLLRQSESYQDLLRQLRAHGSPPSGQ